MHDAMAGKKSTPAVTPLKKPGAAGAADGKGGEHDVSHMKISEVVKKHGPAHEMHSTHDHEADQHHVHTMHGEKHHHSDHPSAEAAMDHMHQAVGAEAPGENEDAFAGEETPDEEMAEQKTGGRGIPGLSS